MTVFAGLVGLIAGALAVLLLDRRRRVRNADRLEALLERLGGDAVPVPRSIESLVAAIDAAVARTSGQRDETDRAVQRLGQALAMVSEGVIICDAVGTIVFRNDASERAGEAAGRAALAEGAITELLEAALAGLPAERHLELYGPPRRSLVINAYPLSSPVDGAVAIVQDVSERRRLDAVRRDFVANVSHELKTPIGALGILAETMDAEDDPEVIRRLAERMHVEAFRVARIIDDLLDLSRIESEEQPLPQAVPVPVHVVVTEAVERVRPIAEHRRVRIVAGEPNRRLTILGDRRQLVSALHNLLENAVKYSDEGSMVEVRARAVADPSASGGPVVELSVEDHGLGIPARDLDRIFERFYRVDRARARDTGGTGLGLAIVRHVATNHGGEVAVTSREGEGSTFTLRLPAGGGPLAVEPPSVEAG